MSFYVSLLVKIRLVVHRKKCIFYVMGFTSLIIDELDTNAIVFYPYLALHLRIIKISTQICRYYVVTAT